MGDITHTHERGMYNTGTCMNGMLSPSAEGLLRTAPRRSIPAASAAAAAAAAVDSTRRAEREMASVARLEEVYVDTANKHTCGDTRKARGGWGKVRMGSSIEVNERKTTG